MYGQVDKRKKKVLLGKRKSIENFLILLKTYKLIQFKYLKNFLMCGEKKTIKNSILGKTKKKNFPKNQSTITTQIFFFYSTIFAIRKCFTYLLHITFYQILWKIYNRKKNVLFAA